MEIPASFLKQMGIDPEKNKKEQEERERKKEKERQERYKNYNMAHEMPKQLKKIKK